MFPFHTDKHDRSWLGALALVAVAQVLALFFVSFRMADGHFMFPLDDAYIHLQYARQLAAGNPLVYTPGAMPSGGMTSPLYVMLLAPMFLIGMGGAKAAFLSFLLGGVLWTLLPVWVFQLAARLTNPLCGLVAAALVLAHGHLLWVFLSGMETGLFTVLLVGAVLGAVVWWQEEKEHGRAVLIACLALLPLARPEGLVAILAAVAIVLARRGEQPRLSVVALVLAGLPMAIWLWLLRYATGDWKPAGLTVKGLAAFPWFTDEQRLGFGADTLVSIATKFYSNIVPDPAYAAFKGMDHMPFVAPGLGVLAMVGAAFGLVGEGRAGRPAGASFLALLWLLGLASLAASLLPFIHQQRYLAPWTVLAIVLAMVALRRVGQLFHQLEDNAVRALGVALVLVAAPSVPWWMAEHGRNSRDIYHLLRVATFSLEGQREPIAVTDAGVLAFYTSSPATDLVGLCSSEFTRSTLHGEGATLEVLSHLPGNRRPAALVGYREWFSDAFPISSGKVLSAIPKTSITSGITIRRMPIDWRRLDAGNEALQAPGERLLWQLDVADLASEKAANYRFRIGPYAADPRAWPQPLCPVEEFLVREDRTPGVRPKDLPTTATVPMVVTPVIGIDGGRVVQHEEWTFAPEGGFPKGQLQLHLRVARPRHAGAPTPVADRVRITVRSNTTGATASREVDLPKPKAGKALKSYLSIDLSDVLDEAGGSAWQVSVDALPEGAYFGSYGYAVVRR